MKKLLFIITIIFTIVMTSSLSFAAFNATKWQLNADGYYYHTGTFDRGEQRIDSNGADLYYRYNILYAGESGREDWSDWTKVYNFNEFIQGATDSDFSKVYLYYEQNPNESSVEYVIKIQQYSGGVSNRSLQNEIALTGIKGLSNQQGTTKIEFRFQQDTNNPVIIQNQTFITNVDAPRDVSYFIQGLTATDNIDGDISANIYVKTDGYTANKNKVGTYQVVYAVKDAAGNEGTLAVYIAVTDTVSPVIQGDAEVALIGNNQSYDIEAFRLTLSVTDNADTTLTNASIILKTDGYTANKTVLGIYNLVFEVTDASGNKATFTKPVKVVDKIPPNIVVKPGWTIVVEPGTKLTKELIIQVLVSSGQMEQPLSLEHITITNNTFTGNESVPGNYSLTLNSTDTEGQEYTQEITITVSKNTDGPTPIDPTPVNPSPDKNIFTNINFSDLEILYVFGLVALILIIIALRDKKNKTKSKGK